MRILVVSNTPWNDGNSLGLSFSNIFDGIPNLEFANIYCSMGNPENKFPMVCYQITAKSLLLNLKNRRRPSGHRVDNHSGMGRTMTAQERAGFDQVRRMRWQLMFWGRDLIWKLGRWKSPELLAFLDEFQPDLIFQPVYFSSYINDIAQFVHRYTKVPMVGYISDDNYTLRQIRLSPLYWIDRLWKRQKVKNTINQCQLLYVISQLQQQEYAKLFWPPCKILTKCADFSSPFVAAAHSPDRPLQLLYAGNVSSGRYASLRLIAQGVQRLCAEGYAMKLHIYTASPLSAQMRAALQSDGATYLHAAIPYAALLEKQQAADVLIHVEGLSLRERLTVRMSFSTKLVDYFALGKCIFAVGSPDVASIAHLLAQHAALVAQSRGDVYQKLKLLAIDAKLIPLYAQNAYECGKCCHDKARMQRMLLEDLEGVVRNGDCAD